MILIRLLLALFVLFCGMWLGHDWTSIPQAIIAFILIMSGFAFAGLTLTEKRPRRGIQYWE